MERSVAKLAVAMFVVGIGASAASETAQQRAQADRASYDQVRPIADVLKKREALPEGEALVRSAFDTASKEYPRPPIFLRGYPLQGDWTIYRNQLSGRVTGRSFNAAVFYKGGQSGFCRAEYTVIYEEEQGDIGASPRAPPSTRMATALR